MTAREDILARIHSALPEPAKNIEGSHASVQRDYQRHGALPPHERMELFIDRLLDYDTEIVQIEATDEIPEAIVRALKGYDASRVLAAAEFPAEWLPKSPTVHVDDHFTTDQIEPFESIITTCEVAVASTGTIILVHTGAQGRRALTLIPDHHVCLVRRKQVVEVVPEALALIAPKSTHPITTISGPSATADIEMTRIRGVHGPRYLTVILYGEL